MEKSIEQIWKEGFDSQVFSTPKIKHLDDLQSVYFIDEFKRKYKTNIILLVITGVLVMVAFIIGGVPLLGIGIGLLFMLLAIFGQRAMHQLDRLNLGNSSYAYLKAFDQWFKELLSFFAKVYRLWLPLLFIGFTLGILQTNFFVPFIGETLLEKFSTSSNLYMWGGVPLAWMLVIGLIAIVLSFLSNYFFQKEVQSIYGGTINRIQRLLAEMEELR